MEIGGSYMTAAHAFWEVVHQQRIPKNVHVIWDLSDKRDDENLEGSSRSWIQLRIRGWIPLRTIMSDQE